MCNDVMYCCNSESQVIKGLMQHFVYYSLVDTKICVDIKFHIYWYYGY